ncbi:MAG: cytochrome c oxidase subunit II [Pseudomonadota bacterium]
MVGLLPAGAFAAQPVDWQFGFQPAASEMMEKIAWFNTFTLVIITVITLFVLALLAYCVVKFNEKANPNPSKTSHNTTIEVVWTVVPILILVVIAIPSFRLLYEQVETPQADLTVKVTGYQWYWGYEYTDEAFQGLSFDSLMLSDPEEMAQKAADHGLAESDVPRLLAVDNDLVVPVGKVVRLHVTAADVLHSFTIPALGFKMDAVPGRLNETWFKADREGIYYGQCSELCGKDHAYMPIGVRVVSDAQFQSFMSAAVEGDIEDAYKILAQKIETDRQLAARAAE